MQSSTGFEAGAAELEQRRGRAVGLFFGAGAALAVSTVLPWVSAGPLISANLSGGGVVYFLALAAAYGAAGYRLREHQESRRLLIALWVLDAWMILNVILVFAQFSREAGDAITVSPAVGVFVASAGVIAGLFATVHLKRMHPPAKAATANIATPVQPAQTVVRAPAPFGPADTPAASQGPVHPAGRPAVLEAAAAGSATDSAPSVPPPPGAVVSPDGWWWWDGAQWRQVPPSHRIV